MSSRGVAAVGRIAPERHSGLCRRIATIESAPSSTRIEGVKLTDREVERLLSNLDIQSFATRDEQEVAGDAEAMARTPGHEKAAEVCVVGRAGFRRSSGSSR